MRTLILALLVLAPTVFAEQPKLEFEVASIKPGDPSEHRVLLQVQPGGKFVTTNTPMKMLVSFAYDVRNFQISGAPSWFDSEPYNIEAKPDSATAAAIPPGPAGAAQMRQMLQALLADRFQLTVHRETREAPIYELVVAKGGPKLKGVPDPAGAGPQGLRLGLGQLTGMAAQIGNLTNLFLPSQLGRTVVDKTGLTGEYDFVLKWTPDPGAGGALGGPPGPDAPPPSDSNSPSLFTALEEQLGLKLQSAKGPVPMIVIDHVEKPAAN